MEPTSKNVILLRTRVGVEDLEPSRRTSQVQWAIGFNQTNLWLREETQFSLDYFVIRLDVLDF